MQNRSPLLLLLFPQRTYQATSAFRNEIEKIICAHSVRSRDLDLAGGGAARPLRAARQGADMGARDTGFKAEFSSGQIVLDEPYRQQHARALAGGDR